MRSVRERSVAEMFERFERAERLGHNGVREFTRVKVSGSRYGYGVECSCGWKATPSSKPIKAAAKAYWHVLEVLDIHPNGGVSVDEIVGAAL